MTDDRIGQALEQWFAIPGLTGKLRFLRDQADLLLTETARSYLEQHPPRAPSGIAGAVAHQVLLSECLESGIEEGGREFHGWLLELWLNQNVLVAKQVILTAWPDPILSEATLSMLAEAEREADDPDERTGLAWHRRLLERMVRARPADEANGDAADPPVPVPFDLSLFLEELERLRNNDHAATWRRRTEVLFALLAHLPENGPREFEEYRAHLETELATTIGRMSQANLLGSTDQAEMPLSRAEALFESAGATFERLSLWTARAAAAQNHANLLIAAHDAGDASAAARAQDLLDAAIAIRRGANLPLELANSLQCLAGLLTARHDGDSAPPVDRAMALLDEALGIFEREGKPYDVACAWLNQANALRCLFRSGVQAAAEQAHVLYRRALAWFRENQFWAEAATTANNQAALLRFEYERGDNAAAVLAHPLYVEARTIRRDLGQGLDAARTALNQAQLQLRECEAGDTAAGVRATPLLDHALEEFRRHGRLVEVAQTLETRALLIQFVQAETIDRIAAQAHPLLDEALRVYRHYDRPVDIARVAQNKANLLRSEFEAGAAGAGAAAHAHALFAEALVLRRRTGQGIDVAGTAQNQAGLYLRQYEDGNVAAAAEAETLFREAIGIFRARKLWVDLAKTEQNLAALLMKRPDPAMSEAERLLDDAMGKATFDLLPVVNLLIRRTRLAMLELQGRSDAVVTAVSDMLSDVSHQLSAIADPRARRRLLREVANLGQRGAEAALASGDSARALAVMEAGRTFELGARLREAEAALDPVSRAALDRGRTELQAAQAAYDRAPRPLDGQPVAHPFDSDDRAAAAAELLRAQNASFAVLRVRLGLDVSFQVPDPDALRDALGPTAALAVPWIGKHSGGFLLLTPAVRDWRHFRLDGLTHATIDPILEQWFAGYARFADDTERSEPFPAIRRFEKVIETVGAAMAANLLTPLREALRAHGMPAAAGGEMASEVVLCVAPKLSVLPLAAAPHPMTGMPFLNDYAVRLVPSLQACVTCTARARRDAPRTLLAITDPLDDLQTAVNPAAASFDPSAVVALTGYRGDARNPHAATPDMVRASAARLRPGFFSFYGHAGWDSTDPDSSAIHLAAPSYQSAQPTDPASFGSAALRALELSACRLAVLAGCETGLIDLDRNPDEFLGLPSALIEAGAAGVIATLWPVPAAATHAAVSDVFAAVIKHGVPPVQALRHTQLRLRDHMDRASGSDWVGLGPRAAGTRRDRVGGSPAWAPFTFIGA